MLSLFVETNCTWARTDEETRGKLEAGRRFADTIEFFLNGRTPYQEEAYGIFPCFPTVAVYLRPCSPEFIRSWHNHFDNYCNFMPG